MKQSEEVSAANNGENNFVYSLTEVAEKLALPVTKVRNYMISFGLESKKDGRKVLLSELSIKFLEQVVRLKANGWSLQQIRNFISGNTSSLPNVAPQHEESRSPQSQKEIEADAVSIEEEKEKKEKEEKNRTQKDLKETVLEEEEEEQQKEQKEEQQSERKEEIREERRQGRSPQQDSRKKQQNQDEYIPLTKELLNEEITSQSKKLGRLRKALAMVRASQKDLLETNADIDRRYVFIAGLRHIRDNWVEKNAS